ncbi:hypothetical protein AMK26_07505 [Streptomyces sp. CB03234]|uniref:hypothetical protein n=1 Tax=Streptomyces sp. (strain CB03234) TaxID=1703937 RepID=UPI00093C6E7E|nr:hypothetical protein [Streptomyces sp. CB03234]OKK05935.1 hypothetical protein AMK26_07505 [Streptomyces sp. CB03234]
MSAEEPGPAGPAGPAEPEKPADPADGGGKDGAEETAAEEPDQRQNAWSARRDLFNHSPWDVTGGVVGADHHGISGGHFTGNVHLGSRTEIVYQFGGAAAAHSSGEVPEATLTRLAARFVTGGDDAFDALVERLRAERVLVLSGAQFTGRRTAALMLLHRLGAAPVRALDRETGPGELAGRIGAGGHVLCDPLTRRDRPLREAHLLAARDRLAEKDAYLVITVGPTAALEDVTPAAWRPPAPAAVLEAHLRAETGGDEETVRKLLALPPVTEFLGRRHQLREAAGYAPVLARYAAGEVEERRIEQFSQAALESQVQEWFEQDEASLHLRDKAFLVALAAFDGGPYALTAEVSDLLYAFLLKTENPSRPPEVPVFGTHIGKRLQLARATSYPEEEQTEWGPVEQLKARYEDDRAALVLLREVWTGHPSARPALIAWLQRLAGDGRPLVRTRAAATVAVLAYTDLPSAMALVIEPWARSNRFRYRLVAVNALTLAHLLGTPNVPRILDAWCESDDQRLCWVAIRTHGLIGPGRPAETLAALRAAARHQHDPDELLTAELAESVELLLLSPAGDRVLSELIRTLHDDRPVLDLALSGFVGACRHTETDERYGRPLVLHWYARAATERGPAAQHIAALWRTALGDRVHTRYALDVLHRWVLAAEREQSVEWELAALLPALVTTASEHQRLDHLLRTRPGEDGAPPPPVAGRLLTVLPRPPH